VKVEMKADKECLLSTRAWRGDTVKIEVVWSEKDKVTILQGICELQAIQFFTEVTAG
jgi:hypothetical protein